MVRCPEISQLLGGPNRNLFSYLVTIANVWDFPRKHQRKEIQYFPFTVFPQLGSLEKILEDFELSLKAEIDVDSSIPKLLGPLKWPQAFLFHAGITEDEVHLGTAHLSIQQLAILPNNSGRESGGKNPPKKKNGTKRHGRFNFFPPERFPWRDRGNFGDTCDRWVETETEKLQKECYC